MAVSLLALFAGVFPPLLLWCVTEPDAEVELCPGCDWLEFCGALLVLCWALPEVEDWLFVWASAIVPISTQIAIRLKTVLLINSSL